MSIKQFFGTVLLLPIAAACGSSPTTPASAAVQYTYKECYKNTSEYLVGVTYSCTPHPCPATGTQCPDVYHAVLQVDRPVVKEQ